MLGPSAGWEERVAALWGRLDDYEDEAAFRAAVDELAGELPDGSAIADFERACAFDSTGHPDDAIPLYRSAIETGLEGVRRRRASIQMASSTRNLGDPVAALEILDAEAARTSDDWDSAVQAFRALALADLGREREAAAVAITAIAPYLPRYNASVGRFGAALLDQS
jgi:hypothetical protein